MPSDFAFCKYTFQSNFNDSMNGQVPVRFPKPDFLFGLQTRQAIAGNQYYSLQNIVALIG
jgi:hypothetical protein